MYINEQALFAHSNLYLAGQKVKKLLIVRWGFSSFSIQKTRKFCRREFCLRSVVQIGIYCLDMSSICENPAETAKETSSVQDQLSADESDSLQDQLSVAETSSVQEQQLAAESGSLQEQLTASESSSLQEQLSASESGRLHDQQQADSWLLNTQAVRVEIQIDNINFVRINGNFTDMASQNFMECSGGGAEQTVSSKSV